MIGYIRDEDELSIRTDDEGEEDSFEIRIESWKNWTNGTEEGINLTIEEVIELRNQLNKYIEGKIINGNG